MCALVLLPLKPEKRPDWQLHRNTGTGQVECPVVAPGIEQMILIVLAGRDADARGEIEIVRAELPVEGHRHQVYVPLAGDVTFAKQPEFAGDALGALAGGALGGKLANVIKPSTLRWLVVSIGVIVSVIYFIRNFGA